MGSQHADRRGNLAAGMQRVRLRLGVAEVLLASDREVRLTDDGIDLPSESLAVLIATAGMAGFDDVDYCGSSEETR